MQYVICYDISDDARRSRVANILLDFGSRTQESVFVAHLDGELAERMRRRLAAVVDEVLDKVNIFTLCEACGKRETVLGSAEVVRDQEWYVI